MTPPPAITAAPTVWSALHAALRDRQPVLVDYHGLRRLICPHALGWKSGRPMLLAYQTGGQTTTATLHPDPTKRWRCMYIEHIDNVIAADADSAWGTAGNYNAAQPFPPTVIDELAIAIPHTPTQP